MKAAPSKPSFRTALLFWIQLGFISFGGPAGQVAIMHEYLVEKKKWISNSKFLHALNYCMLLPGPEAQQLATYMGWLLHGTVGGLAAGLLFILPSMFILLGLSFLYVSFGQIGWISALFLGLKPAVIAIVVVALFKIGKKSLSSFTHYFIALAAFVAIFFFNLPFPLIILGAIFWAVLSKFYQDKVDDIFSSFFTQLFCAGTFKRKQQQKEESHAAEESEYWMNKNSVVAQAHFSLRRLFVQIGIALLLWVLPFFLFYQYSNDFSFWKELSLFFTQAALVTFGGAYAVLPYVAQVSVEKFHWLSNLEMLDGLALGETTPGPLIIVLAYVGFMAGHHHFAASVSMGALGLLTTSFYTFLPSFLFVLIGAPLIEKTQGNKRLKEALGLVTASVVGVMLNLTIYLGAAVLFPKGLSLANMDFMACAWALLSFVALHRFKINMILWIAISALFGLFYYGLILGR